MQLVGIVAVIAIHAWGLMVMAGPSRFRSRCTSMWMMLLMMMMMLLMLVLVMVLMMLPASTIHSPIPPKSLLIPTAAIVIVMMMVMVIMMMMIALRCFITERGIIVAPCWELVLPVVPIIQT
jgi:hypothetical protein